MATRGVGVSPCSESISSDVSDDESLTLSVSYSEDLSELVDGAYSCFNGEDVLRFSCLSEGLRAGFKSNVSLLLGLI